MDKRLYDRLKKIEDHIEVLTKVEGEYLHLEAHKKVMFSGLYLAAEGKNVAEKEANAYSSKQWIDFISGHAAMEAAYNRERRIHELKLKAFDAAYLTFKNEAPAIRRQGGVA